jgi:hypothetical protein
MKIKNRQLVEGQFGHGAIHHSRLRHWFRRKMRPTLGRAEIPFDWSNPIPDPMYPVKNQGISFSCGGQAGSYLIRDLLKTAGKDQGEISAKSMYAPYCAVGGGMTIDAIETCVGAHGANLEATVPSYDANGNPLSEPMYEDRSWETPQTDADALTRAGYTPVSVAIDKDSMAEAIRDYGGIIMLIQGQNGNQPMNWTTATPAPPSKSNPKPLWAHYLWCAFTTTTQIAVYNSWGVQIGSGGKQFFDETYINSGYILDCIAFIPDSMIGSLPVTMPPPWASLLIWFKSLLANK